MVDRELSEGKESKPAIGRERNVRRREDRHNVVFVVRMLRSAGLV